MPELDPHSLISPKLDPCPFCRYIAGTRPCAFVTRGDLASSFMNRVQYERGAILVLPNAHVESILETDAALHVAVYNEVRRVARAMASALHATGLGVFQNNGVSAGQTVPHFHVHLIPRYSTSGTGKRFREEELPHTPHDELERLAALIRGEIA
jgi:histidine triad (HIT) family protein